MDNYHQSGGVSWSDAQTCRTTMSMFIPYELAQPEASQPTKPTSPALDRFEAIAFDRVDSIDSAWDQCTHECPMPMSGNRLLSGADAPGLRDYEWTGCAEHGRGH